MWLWGNIIADRNVMFKYRCNAAMNQALFTEIRRSFFLFSEN